MLLSEAEQVQVGKLHLRKAELTPRGALCKGSAPQPSSADRCLLDKLHLTAREALLGSRSGWIPLPQPGCVEDVMSLLPKLNCGAQPRHCLLWVSARITAQRGGLCVERLGSVFSLALAKETPHTIVMLSK